MHGDGNSLLEEHYYFSSDVTLLAERWKGIEAALHPMTPLLVDSEGTAACYVYLFYADVKKL